MSQPSHQLLEEIIRTHKLAEDHRSRHSTNRYPKAFKTLVRQSMAQGLTAHRIHRATGMCLATIASWTRLSESTKKLISIKHIPNPNDIPKCRILLPSGLEIIAPLALIEDKLKDITTGGAA